MKKQWTYTGRLWRYIAETASWYFITIDPVTAASITSVTKKKSGWGQIPIEVTVGNSTWRTCLFPNKKELFLPIKAEIRKKEKIGEGDIVQVQFIFVTYT